MTEPLITDLLRFTRDAILNEINLELDAEGLPRIQFTGKMFLSVRGIVWYEMIDLEHGVTNWFTGQLPQFAGPGEIVVCASEDDEIIEYDRRLARQAFDDLRALEDEIGLYDNED